MLPTFYYLNLRKMDGYYDCFESHIGQESGSVMSDESYIETVKAENLDKFLTNYTTVIESYGDVVKGIEITENLDIHKPNLLFYLRFQKIIGMSYEVWECHMNPLKDTTVSEERWVETIDADDLDKYIAQAWEEITGLGDELRSVTINTEVVA